MRTPEAETCADRHLRFPPTCMLHPPDVPKDDIACHEEDSMPSGFTRLEDELSQRNINP